MRAYERRAEALRAQIPEVSPAQAEALRRSGAVLLDLREPDELAQGSPQGAVRLPRGLLELQIDAVAPDTSAPVLCLCQSGLRALFAAEALRQLGYADARGVQGGFARWLAEGLPVELPDALDAEARARFARHLRLPEVGEAGQRRLLSARALLIGAGGLGSPAALYLAAAGVGTLGVVDDDRVERSNLQRQILHDDARVGLPKVDSAAQRLEALWPRVRVERLRARFGDDNAAAILDQGWDLVIDGSDNLATRAALNAACVPRGLPQVHGSVYRFEGQVTVFAPGGPCYRCLHPAPAPAALTPDCAQAGVLGVLPGVIGLLQAAEALKLLLGIGQPLIGRLLLYDALQGSFRTLRLPARHGCPTCGGQRVNT